MSKVWDQATIQEYLDIEVQESLTVEYKAADTLHANIPSLLQLRAELEKMIHLDLLGPADGHHEEVDERNVRGQSIAKRPAINSHLSAQT